MDLSNAALKLHAAKYDFDKAMAEMGDVLRRWYQMQAISRRTSKAKVHCLDCDWKGERWECYHGYALVSYDEVGPCDYCPKCDSEQVEEV